MTERRHDLTDEDIAELVARARKYPCRVFDEAEIAALPSRQPADPDAGLGALPWRPVRGYGLGVVASDGRGVVMVHDAARDPEAVLRAILAVPKAIKLARLINKHEDDKELNYARFCEACDLASEVLAIVDGKEERS